MICVADVSGIHACTTCTTIPDMMRGNSHRPPNAMKLKLVNRTYCANDHVSPYTARRIGYCAASTPISATRVNAAADVTKADAMIATRVTWTIRRCRASSRSGSVGSSSERRMARPLHHAYAAGAPASSRRNQRSGRINE